MKKILFVLITLLLTLNIFSQTQVRILGKDEYGNAMGGAYPSTVSSTTGQCRCGSKDRNDPDCNCYRYAENVYIRKFSGNRRR